MSDRRTGRTTRMVFEILADTEPDNHVIARSKVEAARVQALVVAAAESVGWTIEANRLGELRIYGRRITFGTQYADAKGRRCTIYYDGSSCKEYPR